MVAPSVAELFGKVATLVPLVTGRNTQGLVIAMTLEERFKTFLTGKSMTQAEFAEKIHIDESILSKVISGKREASRKVAMMINRGTDGMITFEHLWKIGRD